MRIKKEFALFSRIGDFGCHSFAAWQQIARCRRFLKKKGGWRKEIALTAYPARHLSARVLGTCGVQFRTLASVCERLGLTVLIVPTVAEPESRRKRWSFAEESEAKDRGTKK